MPAASTVARAFELARSGECQNVGDIRRRLKSEGYANYQAHLSGASIKKQLVALMKQNNLPPQEDTRPTVLVP